MTRLHAGIADNVIPGEAVATLNLRYPPDREPAEAEAYLAGLVPDGATLEVAEQRTAGARRRLSGRSVRSSVPVGSRSARSRRGRTSRTSRRRGLDAVNFGPGHTAFAHHPDERVAIDALVTAYEVLGRFLDLADRRGWRRDGSRAANRRALGGGRARRAGRSRRRSRRSIAARCGSPSRRTSGWVVNEWTKKAILLYFRLRKVEPMEVGGLHFLDKIPVKSDYADRGVRVVPPGVARYGSYLAEGVVLMPGFVNIGAWVGPRTMVDTWATVGSCAQIGADVHLSGGVGIGGVLEPPQARPVIVEDGAFIGSRAVVVEGVVVGEGAVIAPNVVLSASVPVIDVTGTGAGRAPRVRPAALGRAAGDAAEGVPGRALRPAVRAHRRHAERVDRSQDVAQRRAAGVRDRDVTSLAEIAVFTDDVATASAFYRGLLGDPVTEWPGGTLFAVGGGKLLVHERAAALGRRAAERGSLRDRGRGSRRGVRVPRRGRVHVPRRGARVSVGPLRLPSRPGWPARGARPA